MKDISISIYWDSLSPGDQVILRGLLEKRGGMKRGMEIPDDQFFFDLEIPPVVIEEIEAYNENKADYEKEITYEKNGK